MFSGTSKFTFTPWFSRNMYAIIKKKYHNETQTAPCSGIGRSEKEGFNMIKGLSHIAVRASDILASVRFYTEILGLQEAFRMYNEDGQLSTVYVYIAPSQYLELFANGTVPAATGKNVIGLCHICLETEDIEKAYEAVRAKGGPLDSELRLGKSKCRMFWTHDPDGNALEIMELTPESLQAQANARLGKQGKQPEG